MPFILGGFRMFFFQCIYFWQIIFYFFCLSAQFGCSFFILGFSTFSESVLKNKNIIIFISYSLFFFSENYFWESKTSFLFLSTSGFFSETILGDKFQNDINQIKSLCFLKQPKGLEKIKIIVKKIH